MTADPWTGSDDVAALLRRCRRAAGLTQAELAGRAGLAVRTVREVERGRTARPHRTTAVLLADALGLRHAHRAAFLAAARGDLPGELPDDRSDRPRDAPRAGVLAGTSSAAGGGHAHDRAGVMTPVTGLLAIPPAAGAPHQPLPAAPGVPARAALPPVPPLVGRDDERDRLAGLVSETAADPGRPPGPVTLVGVAGVGKTALAVAVAHQVGHAFPGGVAFVTADECDSAAFDSLLPSGRARGHPVLLLVDAAERAPTPDRLAAALRRCPPEVRTLVTARVPTGLPDEQCWPVTPLETPPAGTTGFGEAASWPAAALFLTQLAQVRRDSLAEDETAALVSLVRRLGGHPRALMLAAGHGRTLRLPEILARYGDRVLTLPGPAGEAAPLRRAVADSWRLLTPMERAALQQLAVFRGAWSAELAEQLLVRADRSGGTAYGGRPARSGSLGSGGVDPVRVLDRLVATGMVAVRGAGAHRFRVVEVVSAYAREQTPPAAAAATRRTHAEVMADVAAQAVHNPPPTPAESLDRLAADVWAALVHATQADPPTALRLAACLPRWWARHGRHREGRRWLQRLLADRRAAEVDPTVRAWAQLGLGQLAYEHGEATSEEAALAAALAAFRSRGDVAGQLAAARAMSAVCQAAGRYTQSRQHATVALDLAQRHGRVVDAGLAQLVLADDALRTGRVADARRRLAEVDRLGAHTGGGRRLRLLAQVGLAEAARVEGRWEDACRVSARVLRGLASADDLGGPRHLRRTLTTWAQAAAALGHCDEAEQVLARLRRECPPGPARSASSAIVEARLASARADDTLAAEWFSAAAAAAADSGQRRLQIEAMVEVAARLEDASRRAQVRRELTRLLQREEGQLLARERRLLGEA